jgi:hypothetical protein
MYTDIHVYIQWAVGQYMQRHSLHKLEDSYNGKMFASVRTCPVIIQRQLLYVTASIVVSEELCVNKSQN